MLLYWEKAFDRVSWDYLHSAAAAIGLEDYMCEWLRLLYNTQPGDEPEDPEPGTLNRKASTLVLLSAAST